MPRGRQDFEVAIICALPLECDAVKATFDHHWDDHSYGKAPNDWNTYSFGSIKQTHVVLVHMPGMGKSRASSAAAYCQMSFTNIQLCLIVGICGGLPLNTKREREAITLGDVVISQGIVQYDLGRQYSDRLESTEDNRFRPEDSLLSLLSRLEGLHDHKRLQDATAQHLEQLGQGILKNKARYPAPPAEDWLFKANYRHRHREDVGCDICRKCLGMTDPVCKEAEETSCVDLRCNEGSIIRRGGAETAITWVWDQGSLDDTGLSQGSTDIVIKRPGRPVVHFGMFASGDKVMKSGVERNRIAQGEKDIIAFEMEAAGAWSSFPRRCLVIKGVCDYADTHKNKDFQRYAAATAAACTKAFLEEWNKGRRVIDIMGILGHAA
jgi:nucleoside phosphorylase